MSRSAAARVPAWLALPLVALLGAGGYAVVSLGATDRTQATASDQTKNSDHADHSDYADHSGHGDPSHDGPEVTTGAHDHGSATDGHESPPEGHDPASGGHDGAGDQAALPDRPRALVLGGFAAINGAVLVSAAVLRRRGWVGRRARSRDELSRRS